MAGISKEKVTTAMERVCETFEELHLTMEERAIVAYSAYVAAKRFNELEELEQEAKEKPQGIPKVQIITAVFGTVAVILSTISIFLRILR